MAAQQEFNIVGNLLLKVDSAEAGLNKLKNSLSKLEMPKGLENSFKKSFSNLDDVFARYRKQLEKGFDTKADVSNITKIGKELDSELTKVSNNLTKLTGEKVDLKIDTEKVKQATKDLEVVLEQKRKLGQEALEFKINTDKTGIDNVKTVLQEFQRVIGDTKAGNKVGEALLSLDNGDLPKTLSLLKEAEANLGRIGEKKRTAFSATGFTFEGALEAVIKELTTSEGKFDSVINKEKLFKDALNNASSEQLSIVNDMLSKLPLSWEQTAAGAREAAKATEDYAKSTVSMKDQVKQLQQSTQYFFSLRNMINLFKRGVREAIDTVKELDAAMTQTAVVTDFSVGDMWERLPEYTKNANALGASVKDMYESATLYYQQGLKGAEVMNIASETMKMARIGGLEAADATDKMTAALRGFNMEINEASAQRVNDVYSNLAAKTASDTEELGTAMQRTASIAASAGMSFEGTAAFLAQAIETTREPAENLGTAMKTIVARFTELKKNPLEITEVDGEEVSYNKVDTALQSIGVSLKDTNGQFRNLDQVFLDIAQRWDSLSQTQQRYIATTAAGSRQQSRFIAMMSNYERTVELMDYANNSAGASNEQFEKTMESLEAKLNKLKNAWDQFLMGITNNSIIKGAVDGLTSILDKTNSLINTLSRGNGVIKSALSLLTAFMGMKMAGRLANRGIGLLGGLIDPNSTGRQGFKQGAIKQGTTGAAQAKAISDPIVQAVNRIYNQLTGKGAEKPILDRGNWQAYQKSGNEFREVALKGGTFGATIGTLQGLDKSQINTILANNPGIENQLQRTANQYIQNLDLDKGIKDQVSKAVPSIFKAFKQDPNMSPDKFVKSFNPGLLGKSLMQAQEPAVREAGKQMMQSYIDSYQSYAAQGQKAFFEANNISSIKDLALPENERLLKAYKEFSQKRRDAFNSGNLGNEPLLEPTKYDLLAQKVGAVGSVFGTAGQAVTTFGIALSKLGLEGLGSTLTSIGSGLSTVGSTIGSIGMTIAAVGNAGGLGVIFGPIVPYLPIIIAAGVAIGGVTALLVKHNNELKKIKESAAEVSDSYKEINEQTKSNISTLKQYQSQAATLANGVDANGNNVSLSDEEYSQYLEMVDKIAEINPSIVQGYNAQGHAIVNINDALKETIALEERRQKEATKEYTSTGSLQKLLNARNINENYKGVINTYKGSKAEDAGKVQFRTAPMESAVKDTIKQLQKQDWFDAAQFKEQFGIDVDNLTDDMIHKFVNSQDTINSAMVNWANAANGEFSEALTKSFDTLGEQTDAFDEAVQPALQALQTYVTNLPGFENIGEEFRSSIMAGLKDIVIQPDLNARDMQHQAQVLVQEFDNLTAEGGIYATTMKQIKKEQDNFAQSLDASEYAKNTEAELDTLNGLLETYRNKTDAYSQAVADYLENQIERIKNFTTDSEISITQALNGVTDTIDAAEGAYDSFKESTKTDFSTGAENMKSIFEEVTKETDGVALHMERFGDETFWKGVRYLLGDEFVEANANNIEKIKKELRSLEPELEAGEKGFAAFWEEFQKVDESKIKGFTWNDDGSYSIDRDINPDAYKEIADAMHRSEEYVISMLNKGRQFAEIDFTNITDVRKALSTDTAAIQGTDSNKAGQRSIYVKEDYLVNALEEAHIVNPKEQQDQINSLKKEGIKIIPGADSIKESTFTKLGISDIPSLIKTFGDTGVFDREEIQAYAEAYQAAQGETFDAQEFGEQYQSYLDEQEHPELEPLEGIQSLVSQILASVNRTNIREGFLSREEMTGEKALEAARGNVDEVDSTADYFMRGQNAKGKKLSEKEFEKTSALLDDQYNDAAQILADLRAGADKAVTPQDKARFNKEIEYYEDLTEYLLKAKNVGERLQDSGDLSAVGQEDLIVDESTRAAFNQAMSSAWSDLLGGVNPNTLNTPEGAAALEHLINWNFGSLEGDSLRTIQNYLQTLGISLNDALQSGAVDLSKIDISDYYKLAEQFGEEINPAVTELIHNAQQKGKEVADGMSEAAQAATDAINSTNTNLPKVNKLSTNTGGPTQQTDTGTNQTSTYTTNFESTGADDVKQDEDDIKSKADTGATFTLTYTSSGLEDVTEGMPQNSSSTTTLNVKTGEVDRSTEQAARQDIESKESDIPIGVKNETSAGMTRIRSGLNLKTAYIPVEVEARGSTTITVRATTAAKGMNNYIPHSIMPTFGSAAKGKFGTIGPNNKGGLTLTGERGYEVAWLPSQNKSMILGADGPQLINLPKDAVVWDHKQSKNIVKRRGIPAGSMDQGKYIPSVSSTPIVTTTASSNTTKSKNSSNNKSIQKATQEIEKVVKKAGKVLVWWENAAHRMNKVQHNAEITQKKLESMLKEFGITGDLYRNNGEDYKKYLIQQQDIANEKKVRANKELNITDKGRKAVDSYAVKKARQNLKEAKTAYKKNKTEKNKKALAKARQTYNKKADQYLEAIGARREISYEVTKKKKVKGKWKKSKETKKATVNLAGYITTDPVTGEYQINQEKINKVANKNKSKAEAIAQAAEQQLNDLISKQQAAEKEAIEAAEALDNFYNETYATFGAWERTITEAYMLAQDLEKLSSLRNMFETVEDLEFAKLEAGFSDIGKSLPTVTKALQQNKDLLLQQVQANAKLVDAKFEEYRAALSYTEELSDKATYGGTDAAAALDAKQTTLNFLEAIGQSENFDYSAAVAELNKPEWQEKDYEKIKEGLDKIAEKQIDYYDALTETYTTMTEVYQTIEEYQSYMANFENSLINGIEEQTNKEINKLNKLDDSLTTAAKNLIDEVKRKLDERRKQEDNAKTEQDIAKKQQRLAALRADTSGGHQVEIAQLEKELAEAQQNYGRTLEDQLLDKLSAQQDEAAKQREQQIKLLEAQRDLASALGTNVAEVSEWLKDPDKYKEQIRNAWLANQGYDEKGAHDQKQLREQFEVAWTKYIAYAGPNGNNGVLASLEEIVKQNELPEDERTPILSPIEQIRDKMDTLIEKVSEIPLGVKEYSVADLKEDKNGNTRDVATVRKMLTDNNQTSTARDFVSGGYSLKETIEGFDTSELRKDFNAQEFAANNIDYTTARNVFTLSELQEVDEYKDAVQKEIDDIQTEYNKFLYNRGNKKKTKDKKWGKIDKAGFIAQVKRGEQLGKTPYQVAKDLAETDKLTWTQVLKAASTAKYTGKDVKAWNKNAKTNSAFRKAFEKVYGKWSEFASGGFANYTGPAWLDGTPSKPELVLNATDTKNFIALRDVLAKAMKGMGDTSNTYGDIMYEININVDKIEKDYDVDRVVDKVKKEIIKGAGYRNVTQVRNFK